MRGGGRTGELWDLSHQSEKERNVATKGNEWTEDSNISRRHRLVISPDVRVGEYVQNYQGSLGNHRAEYRWWRPFTSLPANGMNCHFEIADPVTPPPLLSRKVFPGLLVMPKAKLPENKKTRGGNTNQKEHLLSLWFFLLFQTSSLPQWVSN